MGSALPRLRQGPANVKRRAMQCDGYFDIETQDWDKFVVGCFMRRDGHTVCWFDRERELVDELLDYSGNVYAHNGGRFDGLWLLNHIARRGLRAECAAAGQRIVSIRVRKLRVLDSAAIIPLPLREAARIGNVHKSYTGLRCRCGRGCGGYCSIRRQGMTKRDRERLERYLIEDCRSGFSMLDSLETFAAEHDIDLGITIGSSAWRTAVRWGKHETTDSGDDLP